MPGKFSRRAAVTLFALGCAAARAEPGYYVVDIYNEPGAVALDLRYWSIRFGGRAATLWPEIGIVYGVNSRWTTELLVSGIGPSRGPFNVDTYNWLNDVLLTQGEYAVDLAIHSRIGRESGDRASDVFELGPALATEFGRTKVNLNAFAVGGFGTAGGDPTQLTYQWQLRHPLRRGLQLGLFGLGELGPWRHWAPLSQQSHRAGPALYGSTDADGGRHLQWQIGVLLGTIGGRHADMVSARLQIAL
ncbi:MAG: hypothetical protein KGN16_14355 [Burkholderiales bacterium]|nr:hypothetical protein [Burkholderiales bacterium]